MGKAMDRSRYRGILGAIVGAWENTTCKSRDTETNAYYEQKEQRQRKTMSKNRHRKTTSRSRDKAII
jgi:hypothetical protein